MKFPRKRRALDSRIQQITGSSSSLAVICLMVLAVGFTVARSDLLIVDMIPTLTGVIITPKVSFAIHSAINVASFDLIKSFLELKQRGYEGKIGEKHSWRKWNTSFS